MQNYRNLKVSAKAKELAVLVYQVTAEFPKSETYGMTDQMRRAAKAVGLAIAEGCGRGSDRELIRFLTYANGSAQEVEYSADLSIDLGFGVAERLRLVMERAVELQKMLCSLINRLKERD